MLDFLRATAGERLPVAAYRSDYEVRFAAAGSHKSWKFERRQHFRQPGHDSWEAFNRGDWDEALRLIEDMRPRLRAVAQEDAARGITLLRVRVVAEPIDPYLQWEMHSLRLRAECGERIRVISPERIAGLETDGELPELLTVGPDTVYEVRYDATGILEGAVRFVDRQVTQRCNSFIEQCYAAGEELDSYFDRAIARLQPPQVV